MSQNTMPKDIVIRESIKSSWTLSGVREITRTFLIIAARATPTKTLRLIQALLSPYRLYTPSQNS